MRKCLLFFALLLCNYLAIAQSASSYGFAATSGTYTQVNDGTATALPLVQADSYISPAQNIGFNFVYEGVTYTSFKMSSNGFISFGGASAALLTTNNFSTANTASRPILAPLWDDEDGNATGGSKALYELTGSAGSRVLTVEWRNWEWFYNSTTPTISFQVKLYETSNNIEFVYRQESGTPSGVSASIGIGSATGSGSGSYLNVTSVTVPAVSSTTVVTDISVRPPTGQVYTFTPPSPCNGTPAPGTPSGTLFPVCTGSTATINVTGGTSGVSGLVYQWEESADGINGWGNVVGGTGATTTSYTTVAYAGVDIYYRLRTTCTPSTGTDVTAVIRLTGPTTPGTQATAIVASTVPTTTSITPSWTNGNGNNRLVYINSTNSFTDPAAAPGTAVTTWANAGQQLVYNGTGTSVTVTGLTTGGTYYFRVYEGTKCGTTYYNNVNTATGNPVALSTAGYLKYTVTRNSGIAYTPVSGSATTLNTASNASSGVWDDINFGAITFFPFTYAGVTVSQFRAVTNGFLTLSSTNTNTAYQNGITNALGNNMILAPFYEDLYVAASGEYVKYEITGTTPNRVLTVQWENVEIYNYPGPSLNFQVKLYEADSHIEYVYGVMQGFDGTNPVNATVTNGYVFSYTTGLTATAWSTPALAGEAIILQQANSTSFTSEGGVSTNEGLNKLSIMPDCYSRYIFTPAGSVRPNDVYPGVPTAPINDEPAGAITLTPLPSIPADLCGSFYTSAFATPTAGIAPEIASTIADDDVWFKFTANSTNTTITLRGSGGYNAAMQVFASGDLNNVLAAKNANGTSGTSLTETITQSDLATVINNEYYVRVYHAGGGTQATATATVSSGVITGFTVTTPGTGYATATTANSGTGATPFVYITDPSGSGAVAKAAVSAGGAITGITIQGSQGGTNYTSPTVTVAPSSFGLTGDFSIVVNATPPALANDDIAGAIDLVAGNTCVTTAGTTIGATASSQTVCGGIADDDVWYKWTVVSPSDILTIQSGAGFNAHVEVFSSSDNTATGTLTSLGCFNATGLAGAEVLSGSALTIGNTLFIRVYHSTSGSGTGTFTICLTNLPTWTGANSTDWSDGGNWSPAGVPTSSNNVLIPNVTNKPVLGAGTYGVNNITINASSSATVNGTGKLQVAGSITSSGLLDVTAGTIEFNGATAQTLAGTVFTGNVKNLVVGNTSGLTLTSSVPVSGSVSFSVSNATLASAGFLTLKSTIAGTAYIADITNAGANSGNTITGSVTAETYIPGGRRAFRFLSHPFSTTLSMSSLIDNIYVTGAGGGFDATTTNSPSAFWFNNATNAWTAFTSTSDASWTQYRGIRTLVRGTRAQTATLTGGAELPNAVTLDASGTLNTGATNVSVPTAGNYHVVGNPYPSPTNIGAVIDATASIGTQYWVWDANASTKGGYVVKAVGGGAYSLAMGGSFVVQPSSGTTLAFSEANKTAAATSGLFRTNPKGILELQLLYNNYPADNLFVRLNEKSAAGMEATDGAKLTNTDMNFYTLSSNNSKLSLDARPLDREDVIKLGLTTNVTTTYRIKVANYGFSNDVTMYLKDRYTNTLTPVDANMEYEFAVTSDAASQGESRFELVMKQVPLLALTTSFDVTITPNPVSEQMTINYSSPEKGQAVVRIFNAAGKAVQTANLGTVDQMGRATINVKGLAAGVYSVEMTIGKERATKQVVKL
jgi:hypothetical protein